MKRKWVLASLSILLIVIMGAIIITAMYRNRGEQIYIFDTPYEKTQYVISDSDVVMYGVRGRIVSETDTMFTVEQTEGRHATFVVDKNLLIMEDARDIQYKEMEVTQLQVGVDSNYESIDLNEPFVINPDKLDEGLYFQSNLDVWQFLASIDSINFVSPRVSGTDIAGQTFEDRLDITTEDNGNHIIYGDHVFETRITTYDTGHNNYEGYQLVYFNTLSGLTARRHLVDVNALLTAYDVGYTITYDDDTQMYQLTLEE